MKKFLILAKKCILAGLGLALVFLFTGCQNTAAMVEESASSAMDSIEEASSTENEVEEISVEASIETAVSEKAEEGSVVIEQESVAAESSETEEAAETPAVSVIGTDTGSETQVVIQVTNGLNLAITSIQFGEPFGGFMTENLMLDGLFLLPGETKTMYFDPTVAAGVTDFNVYLVLEDGKQCTLHSFPYDNMDAVSIVDSGQVVYIEYISLRSGEQRSSEMSEYIIKFGGSGGGEADQGADPNAGCIGDAPTN